MARTFTKPIQIPEAVTISSSDNILSVNGKLGDLSLDIHPLVKINQEDNSIAFSPSNENKETLALTGTMRALTKNLIQGVTEGFEKKLEINGVGYRAKLQGSKLELSLGYSHPVFYDLPEGVTA